MSIASATTVSSPTLYQYEACPFCWKVRVLMSYKGIPCQIEEVHPLNKKELAFSKDYKKVPILVDAEGRQVNESNRIMQHLDQAYPKRPVFAQDETAKVEEKRWMDWCDERLVRALPPVIYKSLGTAIGAFDYITHCGRFNWLQQRVVKYSGAFVMTMVAKKSAKSQGITDPETHLKNLLAEWSEQLSDRSFLGGDQPNGADMSIFGVLKAIEKLPAYTFIKAEPQVDAWYQRMNQVTNMR